MPQPVRAKCHAEISGFTQRPKHAAAMGQIIGISGRLEGALGWVLSMFSRGSATIAIPMFHAVASTDAQKAMLLAAADQALSGPELESFKDLMDDFRPRYGERSKLVHNLWGHSNDHADKALWWRSSDIGSVIAQFSAAPTVEAVAQMMASTDLSLRAMAYTVKDLEDVALRLGEYTVRVNTFILDLWNAHPNLAAATTAATAARPVGGQSQLDLPQSPQTDQRSD